MSAAPAAKTTRRNQGRAARAAQTPQLRLVAAPKRRRAFQAYVGLCVALLAGVGVAVLWLNTSLAEGSFEIQALEGELAALEVNREVINEQLVARGEPGALAARAAGLGMVESAASGYILLREGIIAGSPVAAGTSTDEETGEGPGGQTSTGTSGLGTEGER